MRSLCAILFLAFGLQVWASEVIPPIPEAYFNDYAKVVSADTASRLNQALEDFDRQTSDKIGVAVFTTMQSDSSVEDYTLRVFRSWRVGQKDKNNGAVLFVFVKEHQMFIQVGYGLEGVLPDALCKRIIDEQIVPHFKAGDFDGGLSAGVQSILAATKGEYKGNGQTAAGHGRRESLLPTLFIVIVIILLILGRAGPFGTWVVLSSLGSSGSWGNGRSGGGFSGGGGGLSGGGSCGGGGAGGSW